MSRECFLADADFNHAILRGWLRKEPPMDFLPANEAQLEGIAELEVLEPAAKTHQILANLR